MVKSKKSKQDEYIVMDTLFANLKNWDSTIGRIFPNANKECFIPNAEEKFSSKLEIEDEDSCIPEEYNNEFDLFNQYSANLKTSKQIKCIIDYVDQNFSKDYVNSCDLTGFNVYLNQNTILNRLTLPNIEAKKQVSKKIEFITKDNVTKTIAVSNIKEGETIICEKAVVDVKAPNCVCTNAMNYECNTCWKPVTHFYTCHKCQLAVYCSKACSTEARNNYHHWECQAQKTHLFGLRDYSHLALRMLFYGLNCDFNQNETNYKMMFNLKCNLKLFLKEDIKKILNKSLQIMIYLSKFTNIFSKLYEVPILENFTLIEQFMYLGGLLVRHYAQACVNSVLLPLEDYSYVFETRGLDNLNPALCLNTCNIQHSCIPNVYVNYRRNYCIVKALRDIEAGEEILLNANGLDNFQTILIKQSLFRQKQIDCTCIICNEEKLWDYTGVLFKCPKCSGPMSCVVNYWKCFKCEFCGKDSKLDEKRILLYKMSITIDSCKDSETIVEFLNRCDILIFTQFKQYYYIFVKLISVFLQNGEIVNAIFYINKIKIKMNSNLHRYSKIRIAILSAIINYIIIYAVLNKGPCAKSLIECCKSLMQLLEKSSVYYQYSHQMHQLRAAFNKILGPAAINRNQPQLNDDKNDEDVEKERLRQENVKFLAAVALLELARK